MCYEKRLRPAQFREYGQWLQTSYGVSARRICRVFQRPRSVYTYKSRKDEQAALRMRIRDLAQARVSYGFRRIHILLRREGWKVNHKRVYRLYKLEDLITRPKRPRQHVSACRRMVKITANHPNENWSMDFMSDELYNGQRIKLLTLDPK